MENASLKNLFRPDRFIVGSAVLGMTGVALMMIPEFYPFRHPFNIIGLLGSVLFYSTIPYALISTWRVLRSIISLILVTIAGIGVSAAGISVIWLIPKPHLDFSSDLSSYYFDYVIFIYLIGGFQVGCWIAFLFLKNRIRKTP